MAELEFNVSRQVDGINGDLVTVSRGQEILVEQEARIRTAWIVDIMPDGADSFKVTALVCIADVGTTSPETVQKPLKFVGTGFRHLADPNPTGVRFVTVAEGEDAARALHAHMTKAAKPPETRPTPTDAKVAEESNEGLVIDQGDDLLPPDTPLVVDPVKAKADKKAEKQAAKAQVGKTKATKK